MQPPEEQSLKPGEMNNETPLLVLKPSLFGIIWTLVVTGFLFVTVLLWSLPYFQSTWKHIFQGNWKQVGFDEIMCVIACFVMCIWGVKIFEALFLRNFKLYLDRVEKYYSIGRKVIHLKNAIVIIHICKTPYFPLINYLYVRNVGSYWKGVMYDFDLGSRVDVGRVIDSCRSIGIEFKKSSNFLYKEYRQV